MKKTFYPKEGTYTNNWYVIDATDLPLGRLASTVAKIVSGKFKPVYDPSVDCGDNVIILNTSKVRLTGSKKYNKVYYRHSGFPGGLKSSTSKFLFAAGKSDEIVMHAVKGMLRRHTALGKLQISRVYTYSGADHKHSAQSPKMITMSSTGYSLVSN